MQANLGLERTDINQDDIEAEIKQAQMFMDFSIREWPVEVLINKYTDGIDTNTNEIFIPEYQRDLVWEPDRQSRFIESILVDLPVGYIYGADSNEEDREGCTEIIDGSQRLRTLAEYADGVFPLASGLKYLKKCKGLFFYDLPKSRQRRFLKTTIRMIELSEKVTEEARREIFDRLNTGGVKLKSQEQRRGSIGGDFMSFLETFKTENYAMLSKLMPSTQKLQRNYEYEERLLRFFALSEEYESFEKKVFVFLDEYARKKTSSFDAETMKSELQETLLFVDNNINLGFKKRPKDNSTPRIRFEALAVGVNLAIQEVGAENLKVDDIPNWIESREFKFHTRADGANSKPKVFNRINFVRDNLIGRDVVYHKGIKPKIEFAKD